MLYFTIIEVIGRIPRGCDGRFFSDSPVLPDFYSVHFTINVNNENKHFLNIPKTVNVHYRKLNLLTTSFLCVVRGLYELARVLGCACVGERK